MSSHLNFPRFVIQMSNLHKLVAVSGAIQGLLMRRYQSKHTHAIIVLWSHHRISFYASIYICVWLHYWIMRNLISPQDPMRVRVSVFSCRASEHTLLCPSRCAVCKHTNTHSAYNMMSAAACLPSASCSLVQGAARAFVQRAARSPQAVYPGPDNGERAAWAGRAHTVMRPPTNGRMPPLASDCVTPTRRTVCAQVWTSKTRAERRLMPMCSQ